MVAEQTVHSIRDRREKTKQAINLAMESRWQKAVAANRELLTSLDTDVEALNRLGKALSELGRYSAARKSFAKALAISPNNIIARKNLGRIKTLRDDLIGEQQRRKVPPHFFIEETGKTGVATLVDTAPYEVLAKLSSGEAIQIAVKERNVVASDATGAYLGSIEPRLGLRLISLMAAGNRYAAAVMKVETEGTQIFIKESYQHPNNKGRLSFAAKSPGELRTSNWEGGQFYGGDEDDWSDDGDDELIQRLPAPVGSVARDDE
jgi:tetratricopeptide (TPR) repeat protein